MISIDSYPLKKNKVLEIHSILKKIDPFPEYQRHGKLWNLEKKQLFIDSILSRYDIPKLYLHLLHKPQKKGKKFAIIDGRQRLETIESFLTNKFKLGDYEIPFGEKVVNLKGYEYRDLAKEYLSLRSRIDEFRLPIICVETDDDEIHPIEEMFSRLNRAVSINSAEERNAFPGHMIPLIRKTAKHKFFTKNVKFSDQRYQHREVSVRLLFLEKCIEDEALKDTKKRFLNLFTKEYVDKKPESRIFGKVGKTLNKMSKIFLKDDKLLSAQGRVPIYYLLVRYAMDQRKTRNVTRKKIERFHEDVMKHKKLAQDPANYKKAKPELVHYDRMTIQGTNDAGSIQKRFEIAAKYLHIDSSEITSLSATKQKPKPKAWYEYD